MSVINDEQSNNKLFDKTDLCLHDVFNVIGLASFAALAFTIPEAQRTQEQELLLKEINDPNKTIDEIRNDFFDLRVKQFQKSSICKVSFYKDKPDYLEQGFIRDQIDFDIQDNVEDTQTTKKF